MRIYKHLHKVMLFVNTTRIGRVIRFGLLYCISAAWLWVVNDKFVVHYTRFAYYAERDSPVTEEDRLEPWSGRPASP